MNNHLSTQGLGFGTVVGIGTDIIECDRIGGMLQKHGDEFLQRVFTPREIAYCGDRKMSQLHYAGRWAAKEAILKVLGTGWAKGIQWTDVEIVNLDFPLQRIRDGFCYWVAIEPGALRGSKCIPAWSIFN
jgi:holo-[acyl-carrier-protein] synthase